MDEDNLTYSSEDLKELSLEALEQGDYETARNLAENAEDTAEEGK